MLRFKHKTLIIISGLIWFAAGAYLLPLGLRLIMGSIENTDSSMTTHLPLIQFFSSIFGDKEQAALMLVVLGLVIGFFKGRFILGKSVKRLVNRIKGFSEPTHILKIYSVPYYFLLASMGLIGMAIKFFDLSHDIRGLVDVSIGAALINGAMLYFRVGFLKTSVKTEVA